MTRVLHRYCQRCQQVVRWYEPRPMHVVGAAPQRTIVFPVACMGGNEWGYCPRIVDVRGGLTDPSSPHPPEQQERER